MTTEHKAPTPSLLQTLKAGPLLCDGGMGTLLMAQGLQSGECGELWNVEQPDKITAIHRAYRDAGCRLLTTNSFGATAPSLERHHLDQRVAELNAAAARAALKAAREKPDSRCWVMGDVGPFGGFLEPVGDMSAARLLEIFKEQLRGLKDGGADGVIIETMADPAETAVAVKAAKSIANWPVVVTFAFNHAGDDALFRTMMGVSAHDAMKAAIDQGADIVGANCGTSLSLEDYVRLADKLVQGAGGSGGGTGGTPVIIQPNAGSPVMLEGKLHHPARPADMAKIVPQLLSAGIRIIGGCCGTTPAHLAAMAGALNTRR